MLHSQVVTMALYVYFAASLLGRQWLDPDRPIPGYRVRVYLGQSTQSLVLSPCSQILTDFSFSPIHFLQASGYDYYFPLFTSLEFLFYVGWLKVAEALLNPFGEDDEDFDTNFMIDRNLQVRETSATSSFITAPNIGNTTAFIFGFF